MDIETIYEPSVIQLDKIKNYLISEKINGNLSSIIGGFERKELIVLFRGKELIGFSAYEYEYPVSKINVVEIVKGYRNKGLGKRLANSTIQEIQKNKGEVIELFCSPKDSESFWKTLGFDNLPETRFTNGRVIMYKILIDTLMPDQIDDHDEIIELWNVEPYQANRNESKWRWKINSELKKPIIQPSDCDWQICWRKGEEEIKKGKVKYFSSSPIVFGNFIILRDLKSVKHEAQHSV